MNRNSWTCSHPANDRGDMRDMAGRSNMSGMRPHTDFLAQAANNKSRPVSQATDRAALYFRILRDYSCKPSKICV